MITDFIVSMILHSTRAPYTIMHSCVIKYTFILQEMATMTFNTFNIQTSRLLSLQANFVNVVFFLINKQQTIYTIYINHLHLMKYNIDNVRRI